MLLLDDGRIRMRVLEKKTDSIAAEVLVGGALGSRKGSARPTRCCPWDR
jgi:pyruvate kinase